jgi:hypothetical protein
MGRSGPPEFAARLPLGRQTRNEPVLNEHFVLITGCSGGGKSTLLAELRARGHPVVEEPGRRSRRFSPGRPLGLNRVEVYLSVKAKFAEPGRTALVR